MTTMSAQTVCPNGLTVAANISQGEQPAQMLTTANPKTEWVPASSSSSESEETANVATGNSSVVIETPNLVLSTFSLRHFRNLRRLASDPEIKRYLFWNQDFSDQKLKAIIHYWRMRQKKTGITHWPVYRKYDKAFIGICGFAQNPEVSGVEISLGIMPEFRGNPIVKELYGAVLSYGFSRLGLARILGVCQPENIAVKQLETKFGFRFVRRILIDGMIPYDVSELTPEDLAVAIEKSSD
jgi:ribosomal-protein-alanine N-acetyltransferase